jgi:acyl-CoA synthetase (AMP-forming)/AMP-acid ligase II
MSHAATAVTMMDVLEFRAENCAENGYRFIGSDGAPLATLDYGDLATRSMDIAEALADSAAPGARAILLFPPGLDFVAALFGCFRAGVIPVPVFPPAGLANLQLALGRLTNIIADADPAVLVTTRELLAAKEKSGLAAGPQSLPWLAADDVPAGVGAGWISPRVLGDDIALIQYTSGSTSSPKGVVVRHHQLLSNLEMLRRSMHMSADTPIVGWVPHYHDMGLVGHILNPAYAGCSSYLMSPAAFLRRPALWLETITRFGGVWCGGPNFGFELCCRRVSDEEKANLDLSSWRVAFSGAEKIRPSTFRQFSARFSDCRFSPAAFCPCYGLAEATVFVSAADVGRGSTTVWLDRRRLEKGEIYRVPAGEAGGVALAGCGRPADGLEVRVVDPDTGKSADDDQVGEFWIHGPSIAAGYWRQPELSAQTFRATIAGQDRPFLRTGDLGFMVDGEMCITGRSKEVIVIRGRNVYPTDVEEVVQGCDSRLRPGCGVAFSGSHDDDDGVVVVQEVTETNVSELRHLALSIRQAVVDRLEVPVGDVILVRAGKVPKTTSGKLRRGSCREQYLAGTLASVFEARLAAAPDGKANAAT